MCCLPLPKERVGTFLTQSHTGALIVGVIFVVVAVPIDVVFLVLLLRIRLHLRLLLALFVLVPTVVALVLVLLCLRGPRHFYHSTQKSVAAGAPTAAGAHLTLAKRAKNVGKKRMTPRLLPPIPLRLQRQGLCESRARSRGLYLVAPLHPSIPARRTRGSFHLSLGHARFLP